MPGSQGGAQADYTLDKAAQSVKPVYRVVQLAGVVSAKASW